jgi:4'-phosphopantetheinyl transferase
MTPAAADRDTSPYDLLPDLIRVWRVHLHRVPASFDRLEQLLSRDEMDRARRFHFERDRRRFTLARGALRTILGGYLRIDPKSIVFGYGPQGKPFLAPAGSSIRFNVAHSEELALIAVSRERELGVDVEFVRSMTWAEQIPERFFSPREAAVFRSLPHDLAEPAFFACWTRKEAYIKARGGGLTIPLDHFDVSLEPGKPAALLEVRDDPIEASRWDMVELQPASGYAGALVVQGKGWRFGYRDWPGQAR